MIIDLTKGKGKNITIPMDMMSMGDVHDRLKMNCKRTGQTVMRTINSLGITLYKIGDFYFCSKSDLEAFGIGVNISKPLKKVINCLKDGAKTNEKIAKMLGISRITAYYRLNRLLDFKIIKAYKSNKLQNTLMYELNSDIDDFYLCEKQDIV